MQRRVEHGDPAAGPDDLDGDGQRSDRHRPDELVGDARQAQARRDRGGAHRPDDERGGGAAVQRSGKPRPERQVGCPEALAVLDKHGVDGHHRTNLVHG